MDRTERAGKIATTIVAILAAAYLIFMIGLAIWSMTRKTKTDRLYETLDALDARHSTKGQADDELEELGDDISMAEDDGDVTENNHGQQAEEGTAPTKVSRHSQHQAVDDPVAKGRRAAVRNGDTTLVEHPTYHLQSTNVDDIDVVDVSGAGGAAKGCTYEELKQLASDRLWLERYTESLRRSLTLKLTTYTKMRSKAMIDLRAVSAAGKGGLGGIIGGGGPGADVHNASVLHEALDKVVACVKRRLEILKVSIVARDFTQLFSHKEHGMDTLVGRENVKDFVAGQIYAFSRAPELFLTSFHNMLVLGPSGTGKTKLARCIVYAYGKAGILARYHFREITKKDITNSYVNGSAPMMRAVLVQSLEAGTFQDEAYDTVPPHSGMLGARDHGSEAVTEMVDCLDRYRGKLLYIAGGYEKDMREGFLKANAGMERRFPHIHVLSSYSAKQLTVILVRCIYDKLGWYMTQHEANILYSLIQRELDADPDAYPTQAGDMLNLSDTLAQTIVGTPGIEWRADANTPDEQDANARLLRLGFDKYMRAKVAAKGGKGPQGGGPDDESIEDISTDDGYLGKPTGPNDGTRKTLMDIMASLGKVGR